MRSKKTTSENLYIDCVAMKHRIQEQLWDELKPISVDDYFKKLRKKTAECSLWQEAIKRDKAKV